MVPSKPANPFKIKKIHLAVTGLIMLGLALGLSIPPSMAADGSITHGRETGLPLPRFVSLKAKNVNLRVGPGRKYAINWQYRKQGLPVEIIQEFDQWRRIRDSDGASGWVLHSLLSSKRTAIIAPWERPKIEMGKPVVRVLFDGKDTASHDSTTIAKLQPGLMVSVHECSTTWCEVEAQNTRFWIKHTKMWGVYPAETVSD